MIAKIFKSLWRNLLMLIVSYTLFSLVRPATFYLLDLCGLALGISEFWAYFMATIFAVSASGFGYPKEIAAWLNFSMLCLIALSIICVACVTMENSSAIICTIIFAIEIIVVALVSTRVILRKWKMKKVS